MSYKNDHILNILIKTVGDINDQIAVEIINKRTTDFSDYCLLQIGEAINQIKEILNDK